MNLKRAMWSLLMLVGFVSWTQVQAAGGYFDGPLQPVGTICPITNNIVVASQNSVGYYTDPNNAYPATGDTEYIHATSTNVSPCTNDAVGFRFQLPDGADYAISATNPVICIRRRISDGYVETFTNDANGSCSQTPQAGAGGGTYFGYSAVASGWQFEMRVPVAWNKQLLGLAGPATHKLLAAADTAWGTVIAEQAVTVFYRALFANPSVINQTSTGARVRMDLYSFFKSGTAHVDYGTSTSYGSSVTIGNIADAQIGYGVFADLAGLNAGTTYHWRIRFVTASGTFNSADQTFSTGAAQNFALGVTKNGTGSGTVSSTTAGINCGATCSANFTSGTNVALTAAPATGSSFAGWGGACSGTGACSVTMSANQSVTATFNTTPPPPQIGSVSFEVTGLPSGSSATLGIAGPNGYSDSRTITTGTGQSLSDVEAGAYTVTAPNVTVGTSTYAPDAATQTKTVPAGGNATFRVVYAASTVPTFDLTFTKGGTGTGTVSSSPAGINCGTTCTASFNQNASVTLTAAPAAGSSFASWSGACSGTATTCTITMNAAKAVTATFNPVPTGGVSFKLTVTKSGTGTGGITSNPGGINCGATCSADFAQGNTVSLSATPDATSTFTGWSGACSGTGACSVTMSAAKSVTATFTASGVTPPQPPPSGATATASKASNTPATSTATKGSSNTAALGVNLGLGSSAGTLQSVTLNASGSGNDQLDITLAKLYLDANGNGVVDAGETALAQGGFGANDGTTTLTLATPKALAASSNSRLLVTLDFNSSIAGMPLKAALGSAALALLLGWRSGRRFAVIALAGFAVALTACGPMPGIPSTQTKTYQVTLTAISLKDSSNASIPVSGLPISGTTITVTK